MISRIGAEIKDVKRGKEIKEVELIPQLKDIQKLLGDTCEYFFKGHMSMDNPPFKGFLLEGPPGTGKTELIKQTVRKLDRRLDGFGDKVYYLFVDGASIAAPKWGEAEQNLTQIFERIGTLKKDLTKAKLIILFDDIESIMIRRGVELAKEWHYSINSILFHQLDKINPNDVLICATTNRPELVDAAINTRLYRIEVPPLPFDNLMLVAEEVLQASDISDIDSATVKEKIKTELKKIDNPTIRDAQQITIVECIKGGYWSI